MRLQSRCQPGLGSHLELTVVGRILSLVDGGRWTSLLEAALSSLPPLMGSSLLMASGRVSVGHTSKSEP